jgi:general secretion pathway protein E
MATSGPPPLGPQDALRAVQAPAVAPWTSGPPLLGELLIATAGLSRADLDRALAKQREEGGLLGAVLLRLKIVDEDQLAAGLATQAEMPYLHDLPKAEDIPAELFEQLPINFAKQQLACPLGRDGAGRVQVAIADPTALDVVDDVAVLLGAPVDAIVASPTKILDVINKAYGRLRGGAELEQKKPSGDDDGDEFGAQAEELVDILDLQDEAPIIRFVNSLIFNASRRSASDIHIEPGDKEVIVRNRVDGVLHEVKRAPKAHLPSIIARVKIMAGLNIAEKRLPQDGRIRRKIAGKEVDMRVATVPTAHGERVTIRLLDKLAVLLEPRQHRHRRRHLAIIRASSSSARTASSWSPARPARARPPRSTPALSEINTPDLNILTVEDPSSTSSRASRRSRSRARST